MTQNSRPRSRFRAALSIFIPPLVVFGSLFLIWHLAVTIGGIQSFILPSPPDVFRALIDDFDELMHAASFTAVEMLIGFVIGTATGFGFAVLMTYSSLAKRGFYPVLITTQTIPPIVLAPPLVIGLGFNIWPKVIVTALIVFFPVLVNAYQGLNTVDNDLIKLMKAMNANELRTFRLVRLPGAAPLMFAAMKLAATYAVIGAVFGEWVGSNEGFGVYILHANSRLQTDRVYAAIVVLSSIGIAAFLLVLGWEWLATPWRRRATKRRPMRLIVTSILRKDSTDSESEERPGDNSQVDISPSGQIGRYHRAK